MTTTNADSGTNVHEVAEGIFRINTPVPPSIIPGGFSFNQYLLVNDEPLLFHTGPRKMFPLVSEAVASVLPVESLRHIALSHFEADECGSLNEWLAIAPQAQPLCGRVAALVSVDDVADRPARALGDGEVLALGGHSLKWLDAPHLPHGWETGYLFEENTRTLLCGDLFTQPGRTQPGRGESPVTEDDILGPSEAFREKMDYFSHSKNAPALLERLAMTETAASGKVTAPHCLVRSRMSSRATELERGRKSVSDPVFQARFFSFLC
jgi:glyoxylase-like metal-dependent hydrolase (beta-lactamase superfamily II)